MKTTTHTTFPIEHDGPLRTIILDYADHIDATRSIGKLSDEQAEALAMIVIARLKPRGPEIIARVAQRGIEIVAEMLNQRISHTPTAEANTAAREG